VALLGNAGVATLLWALHRTLSEAITPMAGLAAALLVLTLAHNASRYVRDWDQAQAAE
jgi:hypothetical protein